MKSTQTGPPRWCVALLATLILSIGWTVPAVAQAGSDTLPSAAAGSAESGTKDTKKKAKKSDRWRGSWGVTAGSEYNDNVFRLSSSQQSGLGTEAGRYADMNAPHDVVNTLLVRSLFRSPGRAARRLSVEADARLDIYAFSRRQSALRLRLSADQNLSSRDVVTGRIAFTPGEFRRNYLIGADPSGLPEYAAGTLRTIEGRFGYARMLLDGGGAPDVEAYAHVVGALRDVADFPWRDRHELGMEVGTDLRLGPFGLGLSAGRARAFHNGAVEPVLMENAVMSMELNRDFDVTDVAAVTKLRLWKHARIGFSFERRARDFHAALADDPVFGDRADRRNTYGAELLLNVASGLDLRLGGDYRHQFASRPGRGDTGDEERYSRRTVFLRLEYAP